MEQLGAGIAEQFNGEADGCAMVRRIVGFELLKPPQKRCAFRGGAKQFHRRLNGLIRAQPFGRLFRQISCSVQPVFDAKAWT
jgi:hypothetical protein